MGANNDPELEAEDEHTDDTELDDVDASFEDSEADDEPEGDAEPKGDDDTEEDSDEVEESESEDEAEEEAEPEAKADDKAELDKPEPTPEEQLKAKNREMAEKRLQAKAARQQSIRGQQEAYLEAADPDDPKDLALRQLQIDAYNNKVDANTNKLSNGYDRAIKDFEILRDPSPEIQAEIDDAIDAFQASHVSLDRYGNPVDVRGDLYAYLERKADSIKALTGKGARTQAANKGKERSKVLAAPSRPPKETKKDADLEAFDEEANRW